MPKSFVGRLNIRLHNSCCGSTSARMSCTGSRRWLETIGESFCNKNIASFNENSDWPPGRGSAPFWYHRPKFGSVLPHVIHSPEVNIDDAVLISFCNPWPVPRPQFPTTPAYNGLLWKFSVLIFMSPDFLGFDIYEKNLVLRSILNMSIEQHICYDPYPTWA